MTILGTIGATKGSYICKGEKMIDKKSMNIPKMVKPTVEKPVGIPKMLQNTDISEKHSERYPYEDDKKDQNKAENIVHKRKLIDISEGFSEDEAKIVCEVFSRRFPAVMYAALADEHASLVDLIAGMRKLETNYQGRTHKSI